MANGSTSSNVRRTVSEAGLVHLCGLRLESESDRQIYEEMKACATNLDIPAALTRMYQTHASSSIQRILASPLPGPNHIRRPAAHTHSPGILMITEQAIKVEIRCIFHLSPEKVKAVYRRGSGPTDDDNWIIRWMLWREMTVRGIRQ